MGIKTANNRIFEERDEVNISFLKMLSITPNVIAELQGFTSSI